MAPLSEQTVSTAAVGTHATVAALRRAEEAEAGGDAGKARTVEVVVADVDVLVGAAAFGAAAGRQQSDDVDKGDLGVEKSLWMWLCNEEMRKS